MMPSARVQYRRSRLSIYIRAHCDPVLVVQTIRFRVAAMNPSGDGGHEVHILSV